MKRPMTNEESSSVPFLLRFARPLPEVSYPPLRYDEARQIAQALIEGKWIDALDANVEVMKESTFTRVRPETHDES
jgi:hypothetical protein